MTTYRPQSWPKHFTPLTSPRVLWVSRHKVVGK